LLIHKKAENGQLEPAVRELPDSARRRKQALARDSGNAR
jgi:hypothetical protein